MKPSLNYNASSENFKLSPKSMLYVIKKKIIQLYVFMLVYFMYNFYISIHFWQVGE